MTAEQTTTDPSEPEPTGSDPEPAGEQDASPQEPAAPDDDQGQEPAAREAAKYRRRLRDTEAERDQLSERVAALEAQIIDQAIEDRHGLKPDAVRAAHPDGLEVIGGDGQVDLDLLDQAARDAADRLGLTSTVVPSSRNQGLSGQTNLAPRSWADVLNP